MLKFNLLNRLLVESQCFFKNRMKGCALTLCVWSVEIKMGVGMFELQFLFCYSLPVLPLSGLGGRSIQKNPLLLLAYLDPLLRGAGV